ncbi:MAG: sortase [Patescibacteria group bacterium]
MAVKKGKGPRVKVKSRNRRVHSSQLTVHGFRAKLQFVFSIFLILLGVVLVGYAASKNFDFNIQRSNNPTTQQPVTTRTQFSKIKSISIPKIERDLAVSDGKFENGRWEVAAEGVSFYTQSALPEAGGNTVLYGHNKARILGGLVDMRKGDMIELRLENGELRNYEVTETKTIKPTDVSILSTSTDTILTIYTCSGFLDTSRFVVLAKLVVE